MSDTNQPVQDADAAGHGAASHGAASDHDEHGHAADSLGPIDWRMWGAGVLGVVAGLVTMAAMVAGTGFTFSA